MDGQWYSISQFARHHNLSDMTVRRRIKTGRLKAVLKEGKYYIQAIKDQDTQWHNSLEKNSNGNQSTHLQAGPFREQSFAQRVFANAAVSSVSSSEQEAFYQAQDPFELPKEIQLPFENTNTITADARKLLEFCMRSLEALSHFEATLKAKNQAEIFSLQHELQAKELKISELEQKVVELELLLAVIEKKR